MLQVTGYVTCNCYRIIIFLIMFTYLFSFIKSFFVFDAIACFLTRAERTKQPIKALLGGFESVGKRTLTFYDEFTCFLKAVTGWFLYSKHWEATK